MADPDIAWLFSLFVPLVVWIVLGAAAVSWSRKRALDGWDIAESPQAPVPRWPTSVLAIVASAVAVGYACYNFLGMEIPPDQQWSNSGLWALGSALGVLAAHFLGKWLAEPKYTTGG